MHKQKKGKKKFVMLIALALAAVITLGATFAWMTAKDSVVNRLETSLITDGSAVIREVFVEEPDWRDGQTITKEVSVVNNGSSEVLARLHFEEVMHLLKTPIASSNVFASGYYQGTGVPQVFNTSAYAGVEWTDFAAAGLDVTILDELDQTVSTLPTGLIFKVQKKVTNAGLSNEKRSYAFIAYYEIDINGDEFDGKAQRVTADFDVVLGRDGAADQLTVSNLKYWAYTGRDKREAKWIDTPPTAIDNPIVDYGKDKLDPKPKITIDYTNRAALVVDPADLLESNGTVKANMKDQWWYDESSGYFYFVGKILPGGATPNMMNSLTLADDASEEYLGMQFELTVKMEAIQNTAAALSASDGWNLSDTSEIYKALANYCI